MEVGPYRLSRIDFVVAAWVLGLRLGSRKAKFRAWLILVVGAAGFLIGLLSAEMGLVFFSLFLLALIFLVTPALQKCEPTIVSFDEEGMHRRWGAHRTLTEWSGISEATIAARRLFIMISPDCAVTIPHHAVPDGSLEEVMQKIVALRAG